jgi:hypothetical protein
MSKTKLCTYSAETVTARSAFLALTLLCSRFIGLAAPSPLPKPMISSCDPYFRSVVNTYVYRKGIKVAMSVAEKSNQFSSHAIQPDTVPATAMRVRK